MLETGSLINQVLATVIDVIYFIVVIGTIIVIVLDNRNPVKTIAWLLVLIFLPLLGVVFYIFFGRSGRKERMISRKSYHRLMKRPMAEFLSQESSHFSDEHQHLINFFGYTNQSLPFDGNEIDIYTNGYDKLQSLIHELYKAKHHIHIQYYIIEDDAIGRLIRDVLIDKVREGVMVRLLYDDVGCWNVPKCFFEQMCAEGIDARGFLKVRFPLFTSRVNYRNHRKLVVIDGQVGFVGGMNLAERYVRGLTWGIWRDTHLRIKGKAVYGLQTSFLMDWYFVDQSLITSVEYFPKLEIKGNNVAQIVTSEPVGDWKEIMQGLSLAINNSRKYFYIQTPYFLPTDSIMVALQTAALAGVDVRLMMSSRSDSKLTQYASYSYLLNILKAGVKVYFYKKGFMHSKMAVSDDTLSTVGSTNMDFRSFEHNFEINSFMYDRNTAVKLKEIFLVDQRDSEQILLKNWKKRPLSRKAAESIMRLFSPLL